MAEHVRLLFVSWWLHLTENIMFLNIKEKEVLVQWKFFKLHTRELVFGILKETIGDS